MTLFTVNRGRREKCTRGTFPHLRTAVTSMTANMDAADNVAAGPAAPANARQQRGRTALIWRCNPHDEEEHPLDMLPRAASAYQLAYAPPEKLFSEGHTLPGYPYGSLEEVDVNVVLAETPALREALADLEAGAGDARPLALPGPMMLLSSLVDPAAVYRARRDPRLDETLGALADALAAYARAAIGAGARVLSLADAEGCCELAGRRFFTEHSGPALVRFLDGVDPALDRALVHLCGKTSVSLTGTGMAQAEPVRIPQAASYQEALFSQAGNPKMRVVGHGCVHARGGPWSQLTRLSTTWERASRRT